MNSPGRPGGPDAEAAVVLASGAGGDELAAVHDTLTGALGTPSVLIGQAGLAATPVTLDLTSGLLDVGGRRVRPTVVWARHWGAGTIAAHARPAGRVSPLDAAAWSEFIGQLTQSAAVTLPGTAPAPAGQLADAARLGVPAPRTVLTTDAAAGARQLGSPRVVVKTANFRLYEPDRQAWQACWPRITRRDAVTADAAERGRPVIVQEYVEHVRELRVYYLGGAICAFAVGKAHPSSPWTDPLSVSVTPVDCPPGAAGVVQTLSTAWQLSYGAFDLLVTGAGETVFLEVNQDGDWLWYERRARWHGVSFLAAAMVGALFAQVAV